MTTSTELVTYIVHPASVELIDDAGDSIWTDEPFLYDELVLAGYPLTNDAALGGYYIDIGVRGDQVIVFTAHPAVEHDMGPVAELFLGWHIRNGV